MSKEQYRLPIGGNMLSAQEHSFTPNRHTTTLLSYDIHKNTVGCRKTGVGTIPIDF